MTQNYDTWSETEKRSAYFSLIAECRRLREALDRTMAELRDIIWPRKPDGECGKDCRICRAEEIIDSTLAPRAGAFVLDTYLCINGHRNDHANLAPGGRIMCATPSCRAEAEAEPRKGGERK